VCVPVCVCMCERVSTVKKDLHHDGGKNYDYDRNR